jgi:hypothetical protein
LSHHGAALRDGFDRISYNMVGKADRASVQAALAQKVSHAEAALTLVQKSSHDALVGRVRCCIALGCFFAVVSMAVVFGVIYMLLQQQYQIQNLRSSNLDLSHTVDELSMQNQKLKHADFAQKWPLLATGESIEAAQYVSEFHSNQLHEGGYSIELKPPCKNAWVNVEASFRSGHTRCYAKADIILREDHYIFGLLPDTEQESKESTLVVATMAGSSDEDTRASCDSSSDSGAFSTTSTTTITADSPCMVITATMKMKQDGSVVPSLSVKPSSSRLAESNDTYIYDVSGKIQWSRQ